MITDCLIFAAGMVVGSIAGIFAIALVRMNRNDEGGSHE